MYADSIYRLVFVLLMYVFYCENLLILNNNRTMEIELPSGKLIDGVELIYKVQGKYYTLDNQEYLASRYFTYFNK